MGFFDRLFGRRKETAHSTPAPNANGPAPPVLDLPLDLAAEGDLTDAIATFGIALGRGSDSNVVCSAFSVYEAWLRVWAGSAGSCRTELDSALGVADEESTRRARTAVLAAIDAATGDDCEVRNANTIFVRPGLPLHDEFERMWGGATTELDFGDPDTAAAAVNAWVSEQTNAMIEDIVDPRRLSASTVMMIANAIYLRAKWQEPFQRSSTHSADFRLLDGTRVKLPTMANMHGYRCAATPDFELVIKPYRGDGLAMVIVLPREGRFEAVRDQLEWGTVKAAIDGAGVLLTTLYLPKFAIESSPEIDPLLRSRGAGAVYQPETADLSAMSPRARDAGEELFVGSTAHRARIDVDEEGTEAAAATVIEVQAGSAPPRPYVLRVDRPFLFFIVEQTTGTPLFGGQVVDPR